MTTPAQPQSTQLPTSAMTMHQSNFAEIFNYIDALVFDMTGKHLGILQKRLMEALWSNPRQRYEEIAHEIGYSPGYLGRDAGPKLWRLLSNILGEKVKKSNFRAVIERFLSVYNLQVEMG